MSSGRRADRELLQLRALALEEHAFRRGAVARTTAEHSGKLPVPTVRLERAPLHAPLGIRARLDDARRAGITERERGQADRQIVRAVDVPLDRRGEALARRDDDACRPARLDEGLRHVETVEEAVARVLHVHDRGAVAAERRLQHVGGCRLRHVVGSRRKDDEIDVLGLDARGGQGPFRGPRREIRRADAVGRIAPLGDTRREPDDALGDLKPAAAFVDTRLDHRGGPHVVGHVASGAGDQGPDAKPVCLLHRGPLRRPLCCFHASGPTLAIEGSVPPPGNP